MNRSVWPFFYLSSSLSLSFLFILSSALQHELLVYGSCVRAVRCVSFSMHLLKNHSLLSLPLSSGSRLACTAALKKSCACERAWCTFVCAQNIPIKALQCFPTCTPFDEEKQKQQQQQRFTSTQLLLLLLVAGRFVCVRAFGCDFFFVSFLKFSCAPFVCSYTRQ